jgi:FSR family fosmidomycin resistance protein-like MFS transporter
VALFVLGVGVAGWYPLAQAGAYAALPGRSGTVLAVTQVLGAPVSIGLPVVTGMVAETAGLPACLALLGLAPLVALLIVPASAPDSGSRPDQPD